MVAPVLNMSLDSGAMGATAESSENEGDESVQCDASAES